MHEFSFGEARRAPTNLAPALFEELRRTRQSVTSRSLLNWAEHCSECAMPECYATCSLYTPRPDFKCRRFDQGIEAKAARGATGGVIPLMSVTFRRWGKLEAKGDIALVAANRAALLEAVEPAMASLFESALIPFPLRRKAAKAGDLAKAAAGAAAAGRDQPDVFILEVINDSTQIVPLTLTIKSATSATSALFQAFAEVKAGYNRFLFPAQDILSRIGPDAPYLFQIEPIRVTDDMPALLFGMVDLAVVKPGSEFIIPPAGVTASPQSPAKAALPAKAADAASRPKVKCVVWDLDNTLWAGTLIEDGPDGVRQNAKAASLVIDLDRRGILNSIASKNSGGVAETVLERFGLAEYFLYPQIHWDPKSRSIDRIAKALNIGRDSLVLIDDQVFERSEVEHACPDVQTFDIDAIETLLDHPRLDVPVTEESRKRRSMYKVEQARLSALDETGGDYAAFLRTCGIKLVVTELDASQMNRAFELTERTNQLNYSGRRLSRADLEAKRQDKDTIVLVLSVSDRFGDYGVVGVCVLNLASLTVECFFMSCRVQRKKVENAFFAHLLALGVRLHQPTLSIVYRPTAKNEPSREVLQDEMKFRLVETGGDDRLFQLSAADGLPDGDVVGVDDRTRLVGITAPRLEPA